MEPHKHCHICGKPVPIDETYCSEKCREDYKELISSRKKKMYIIYGLLAILLILMFFRLG